MPFLFALAGNFNEKADYDLAKNAYEICDYGILTPRFGIDAKKDELAETELAKAIVFLATHQKERKIFKVRSPERANVFSKEAAIEELNGVIRYVGGIVK